jgi:hypothetical protein
MVTRMICGRPAGPDAGSGPAPLSDALRSSCPASGDPALVAAARPGPVRGDVQRHPPVARGTGILRSPVDLVTPVADHGRVEGLHVCRPPFSRGYVAGLATTAPPGPDGTGPVDLMPGGSR